jgi:hypothetical protein
MNSIPKEIEIKVETPKPRGAQTSLSTYMGTIYKTSAYKPLHPTTSAAKYAASLNQKAQQLLIIHAKMNKPANQYLEVARSTLDHSKQASRNVQYAIRK